MRISDWSSDVCSSDLPETVTAWLAGAEHRVPLHQRANLAPGRTIAGPAIIIDALSTTVVEPGWTATVKQEGTLRLHKSPSSSEEGFGVVDAGYSLMPKMPPKALRSEEHTSELQSQMRIPYAVFCLKKKNSDITVT